MRDNDNNIFLIDLDSITFDPKPNYTLCLPTWSYAPCNIFNLVIWSPNSNTENWVRVVDFNCNHTLDVYALSVVFYEFFFRISILDNYLTHSLTRS